MPSRSARTLFTFRSRSETISTGTGALFSMVERLMEKLSLKGQVLALAERVSSVRDAPMFSKAAAAEAALVDAVKLLSHMCARIEALEAGRA